MHLSQGRLHLWYMKNLQIGRLAGIPLQVHWTFVLVPLWLLYESWQPNGYFDYKHFGWLGMWVALVFLTVLLHELGHALVARYWQVPTERIVFYPIGGGAYLKRMPREAGKEAGIAAAGPVVNFLLAALVAPFIYFGSNENFLLILRRWWSPYSNVVLFNASWWEYGVAIFFGVNLVLGILNLLPAFPMDGGRIFRAFLSKLMPRSMATYIAGTVGIMFGLGLLFWSWQSDDPLMAAGAVFLSTMAWSEISRQRQRSHWRKQTVASHYQTTFHRLYLGPTQTVAKARITLEGQTDGPVLLLDEWQMPRATTHTSVLRSTELDNYINTPLSELLDGGQWQAVCLEDNMLKAVDLLEDNSLYAVLVMNKYGQVQGLIGREVLYQ